MGQLELLDMATDRFAALGPTIKNEAWTNPTPCAEWDVAALVDHVIGGNVFTVEILNGSSTQDALVVAHSTFERRTERRALLAQSLADQRRAFSEDGALDRVCAHVSGDVSGARVLGLRLIDLTVHAWDLAVGLGVDAALHPRLAEAAWALVDPSFASTGMFGEGPSGTIGDDAPVADRLLDALGRRPGRARHLAPGYAHRTSQPGERP